MLNYKARLKQSTSVGYSLLMHFFMWKSWILHTQFHTNPWLLDQTTCLKMLFVVSSHNSGYLFFCSSATGSRGSSYPPAISPMKTASCGTAPLPKKTPWPSDPHPLTLNHIKKTHTTFNLHLHYKQHHSCVIQAPTSSVLIAATINWQRKRSFVVTQIEFFATLVFALLEVRTTWK